MDDTIRFPQIIDEQPRCEYRYEIELGMIIGSAIDEPTKEGIKHILGYTVFNDGCLRGQRPSYVTFDWTGSKCGYQASSAGPWIATRDEFGDNQPDQIGRASCRERGCQLVEVSVVAVSLKKKK